MPGEYVVNELIIEAFRVSVSVRVKVMMSTRVMTSMLRHFRFGLGLGLRRVHNNRHRRH